MVPSLRCLPPNGRVSTGCSASRVLRLRELYLPPPCTFEIERAIRGVTPALSACRRPLHRRLVESEKPTASPRRSPETQLNLVSHASHTSRIYHAFSKGGGDANRHGWGLRASVKTSTRVRPAIRSPPLGHRLRSTNAEVPGSRKTRPCR